MNRVDLLEVADCLERILSQIDLGQMPDVDDLQFARLAIASFRSPPTADELKQMLDFGDGVRRAAMGLKVQAN